MFRKVKQLFTAAIIGVSVVALGQDVCIEVDTSTCEHVGGDVFECKYKIVPCK